MGHRQILQQNLVALVTKIDFKTTLIPEKIVQKGIVSMNDMEYIKEKYPATRDQKREFMKILYKGDYKMYLLFREILISSSQKHIVEDHMPLVDEITEITPKECRLDVTELDHGLYSKEMQVLPECEVACSFTNNILTLQKTNSFNSRKGILTLDLIEEIYSYTAWQIKNFDVKSIDFANMANWLFEFMSRCQNLDTVTFLDIKDSSQDNKHISNGLQLVFEKLSDVGAIDIRSTYFGANATLFLEQMKFPALRNITLPQCTLTGSERALSLCLLRHPGLRWIDLSGTRLKGTDMECVLQAIGHGFTKLWGLMLGECNLEHFGDHFHSVLKNMPELRVVSVPLCKLSEKNIVGTIEAIGPNVEVLDILYNASILSLIELFLVEVSKKDNLRFIRTHDRQFSSSGMEKLSRIMQARSGEIFHDSENFKGFISVITNFGRQCNFP